MEPAANVPTSWSRRQWAGVSCLVLLLHFLLIAVLSHRPGEAARRSVPFEPAVRLLPPAVSAGVANALGTSGDPTLFALTSPHGFSGRAWVDFEFFQHELGDWRETPRWLAPPAAGFGGTFLQFAGNAGTNLLRFQEGAPPRMPLARFGSVPVPTNTVLRLEGALATRPLVGAVELAPWPHTDLLGHTTVQVAVTAAGEVLSARLLGSSGSKAADQRALELAHTLRFAPAIASGGNAPGDRMPVWGTVVFQWAVTEPATNGAPAPAPQVVPVTP